MRFKPETPVADGPTAADQKLRKSDKVDHLREWRLPTNPDKTDCCHTGSYHEESLKKFTIWNYIQKNFKKSSLKNQLDDVIFIEPNHVKWKRTRLRYFLGKDPRNPRNLFCFIEQASLALVNGTCEKFKLVLPWMINKTSESEKGRKRK